MNQNELYQERDLVLLGPEFIFVIDLVKFVTVLAIAVSVDYSAAILLVRKLSGRGRLCF